MATGSRIIQHFVFANDAQIVKGEIWSNGNPKGWYAKDYFNGIFDDKLSELPYTYYGNIKLGNDIIYARLIIPSWYWFVGSYINVKRKSLYVSITYQYYEERNGRFERSFSEDFSSIRFPRGYDIHNPPKFRMTDGIQLSVRKSQGRILEKYFERK
jgi:hypothetical protein